MKTINLKEESPSVAQLLAMARKKSVLLVSKNGATFVLEGADEFDREVAELGGSEKFIKFLAKRSKEPAVTSIADNIVHMRALYGLDDGINDATVPYNVTPTAGDGIVDRYVDAATFNALLAAVPPPVLTPWARLIAVRIAVVSRSALPEKASSGLATDPCDATPATAEPQWTGTPWAGAPFNYKTRLDVSASVAAPDDWKCYRYRVFETTIPLRNWIWKSS